MDPYIKEAILKGIIETIQMTVFGALFAYIIGLPLGVILYLSAKGHLFENRIVNAVVGVIVNVCRSLPFLILLVLLIPFTRAVTDSARTAAQIAPLVKADSVIIFVSCPFALTIINVF